MREELIENGFDRDIIAFSFKARFRNKDDGFYYSKFIPSESKYANNNELEVGVILNPEYNSMEVYICDCVVGCCGKDFGVHPFSIDKINSLIKDYITFLEEIG